MNSQYFLLGFLFVLCVRRNYNLVCFCGNVSVIDQADLIFLRVIFPFLFKYSTEHSVNLMSVETKQYNIDYKINDKSLKL